jgi:hypothetical protein
MAIAAAIAAVARHHPPGARWVCTGPGASPCPLGVGGVVHLPAQNRTKKRVLCFRCATSTTKARHLDFAIRQSLASNQALSSPGDAQPAARSCGWPARALRPDAIIRVIFPFWNAIACRVALASLERRDVLLSFTRFLVFSSVLSRSIAEHVVFWYATNTCSCYVCSR